MTATLEVGRRVQTVSSALKGWNIEPFSQFQSAVTDIIH